MAMVWQARQATSLETITIPTPTAAACRGRTSRLGTGATAVVAAAAVALVSRPSEADTAEGPAQTAGAIDRGAVSSPLSGAFQAALRLPQSVWQSFWAWPRGLIGPTTTIAAAAGGRGAPAGGGGAGEAHPLLVLPPPVRAAAPASPSAVAFRPTTSSARHGPARSSSSSSALAFIAPRPQSAARVLAMSSKAGGAGGDDGGGSGSKSSPAGTDGDGSGSGEGEWRGHIAGEGRLGGWGFVATAARDLQDGFFDARQLVGAADSKGLTWMGGDVATSIRLGEGRYLWVFGDTLIGKDVRASSFKEKGNIHAFPRQTVAIATMDGPAPRDVRFIWKRRAGPAMDRYDAGVEDKIVVPGVTPELQAEAEKEAAAGGGLPKKKPPHNVISLFDPSPAVLQPTPPPLPFPGADAAAGGAQNKTLVLGPEDEPPPPPSEEEAEEGAWYWVLSGTRADGVDDAGASSSSSSSSFSPPSPLFLTASIVTRTKANVLGFDVVGTGALLVENPDDDPQEWRYRQVRVPGTRTSLTWSSGLMRGRGEDADWLYLVGVRGEGIEATQVLARVPWEAATQRLDFADMEVWARAPPAAEGEEKQQGGGDVDEATEAAAAQAPRWVSYSVYLTVEPYYTLEPLLPWGHLGVTELSLEYDPDLRSYLMATLPAFSNKVHLWTADAVTGPWAPTLVVDVNEFERHLQATQPAYRTGDKQRLFYSAKLHPELSPSSSSCPDEGDRGGSGSSSSNLFFASLSRQRQCDESERAAAVEGKELVLSYCANVLGDWPAPADYTPRFLRVRLARAAEERETNDDL